MKKLVTSITVLLICTSAYAQSFLVERVIDGDTIKLSNGERVRLIGVDTPETVHPRKPVEYFGKEASAFTKRLCEGKFVRLEYDQNKRDRYRRLLAYVYLEDGTFVNAEIIKQGYGYAYTKYLFKYMEEFKGYEKEARRSEYGLWKKREQQDKDGHVVKVLEEDEISKSTFKIKEFLKE